MSENIVSATMAEATRKLTRKQVRARLEDWHGRVHTLYESVLAHLPPEYTFDRTGKHFAAEEAVQRAKLQRGDIPGVDILRVERSGRLAALFQPRSLWIIGANGRIDLSVLPRTGGRRLFLLTDLSPPMAARSDWRIVRLTDRLHQPPFHPETFSELLE